jgi:hypothetical protein
VKKAGIWSLPEYAGLRQKLCSAVPDPVVKTAVGGWWTVDVSRPAEIHDNEGNVTTERYFPNVPVGSGSRLWADVQSL